MPPCSLALSSMAHSSSWRRYPKHETPLKIVHEILQANLGSGPHLANGAQEFTAHRRDLVAKHMLDARPNASPALIRGLLRSRQRGAPIAFIVNPRAEFAPFQGVFQSPGSDRRHRPTRHVLRSSAARLRRGLDCQARPRQSR